MAANQAPILFRLRCMKTPPQFPLEFLTLVLGLIGGENTTNERYLRENGLHRSRIYKLAPCMGRCGRPENLNHKILRNLPGNFRYQFWRIALFIERKREDNAAVTVLIAVVSWLCAPVSSFAKSPKSHGANRWCQNSVTWVRRINFKVQTLP
jgi:hypothetical protein